MSTGAGCFSPPKTACSTGSISPVIQIASGDLNHSQLVRAAAETGKKLILSTGMATLQEIEQALKDHLGVEEICWLGRGVEGDDTHGHVDDICRFVSADTVVLAYDPENAAMRENRDRLASFRYGKGSGRRLETIELPCPQPRSFKGHPLPASYANFYIANQAVLVPTFNDPSDCKALGILQECFPGRKVTGIHAVDLVWGLGAIHCLTQQQPKGTPWIP